MNVERWKQVEALFESALEREPAERATFLAAACGDDTALRREVESLLAHQQPTGRFISTLVNDAVKLFPPPPQADSDARFIPGTVLAGRYRIIGLLGRGGMGEVYRADDLKLGQAVALKFLPEDVAKDTAVLTRFHREVRIARQISHSNICRVFDIGETDGHHFLSMEYIDGEDLSSLLRRIGRLPADKAVEIARQLCAGLAAAHDEGVLHRDLKPANVMIDGRGKARITDFGLAGLAGEFHGAEVRAGTPAYMAPEQLAGREVTARSDIYALGLLLYEIFTGKKAFEAATLEELIRQHETSAPPSISNYVKEVDPLVERIVVRCLARDPQDRPASVAQVAAALPGGDPLAAALAAGETPSPEMVAAAPREGALRPAVAVACLSVLLILMAAIVMLSQTVMLQNRAGLNKSPEVLAERAGSLISKLGYGQPPADTAYGLAIDRSYDRNWRQTDSSADYLGAIYYWYRQSPRYLEPLNEFKVSLADPPMTVSNMATVTLDPGGRLLNFHAVPPQTEAVNRQAAVADWPLLFGEAGLELSRFAATDSTWVPPMAYDTRAAWLGAYTERPEMPVRVEAASFRGKPVYFQVVRPWERPLAEEELQARPARRMAGILLTSLFFAGLTGGVLLARRNLRLGRGDRKGAFKLALFCFAVQMAGALLYGSHLPSLSGELAVWYQSAAWALFSAVLLWVLYVALEPYVRRRWPGLMISWSRLLAGGFRDPMVGRDILIGGLLGLVHVAAIYSATLLPKWFGLPSFANPGVNLSAYGVRGLAATFLSDSLLQVLLLGVSIMFLFLLLYVLLRRKGLAAAALWFLQVSIVMLAFILPAPWTSWIMPPVIATAYTIAVTRFGLLATISLQFFFDLMFHYPITADPSSWLFGPTLFSVITLTLLAIYGAYTSIGGQPLFRSEILQD